MRQLEFLTIEVRVRVTEGPRDRRVMWSNLPNEAQSEVIERLAEMLRAKLERKLPAEVRDD